MQVHREAARPKGVTPPRVLTIKKPRNSMGFCFSNNLTFNRSDYLDPFDTIAYQHKQKKGVFTLPKLFNG